ncbi:MAG: cell wall-binding repeat-containing protein [Actinobacteria bacterium]|nr:cell wall-binding repeat-containing protein [Actinomycetota bacterium]
MRLKSIVLLAVACVAVTASPAGADSDKVVDVQLASVRTNGESGSGHFQRPALSSDGRYVTFLGPGSALLPGGDETRRDIYIRDLVAGSTERVLTGAIGDRWNPDVSDDGRYVVFQTDLQRVPADTDEDHDVYLRDRETGDETLLSGSVPGDAVEPSMSADAGTVAFRSTGVWVVDTGTAVAVQVESEAAAPLTAHALSRSGRFLTFVTGEEVVLHDLETDSEVSVAQLGESSCPVVEGGSRTAAPVVADTGDVVYRNSSCRPRLWTRSDGENHPAYHTRSGAPLREGFAPSGMPAISADGSVVVFASAAPDLTPGMVNWGGGNRPNLASYVRSDTGTETVQLVSYTSEGRVVGGDHETDRTLHDRHPNAPTIYDHPAAVSADGQVVAWSSRLAGLAGEDTNPGLDVYVRGAEAGWQAPPFACPDGAYFSTVEEECQDVVRRLAGADRYVTAALVGALHFQAAADHAVVASGQTFPDGLTAAVIAGRAAETVFLVRRDDVPHPTTDEILRHFPHAVSLAGGPAAISEEVQEELNGFYDPVFSLDARDRVGGTDRYATAALLSQRANRTGTPVHVASGEDWPDALTGAVAAIRDGAALLLVRREVIPEVTREELDRLRPASITVLGGPAAVSDAVAAKLAGHTSGDVRRLWGADRYATAVAISRAAFPDPDAVDTVYIATGEQFADALGAAAGAGMVGWPVLLVPSDGPVPDAVRDELERLTPDGLVLLGGEAALGPAVEAELAGLLG